MANLIDCIGNTPVIRLRSVPKDGRSKIWAKLENLNPAGSIKDRACIAMLRQAEHKNLIEPGKTTVIEASSGNTAIGIALCCRAGGYDFTVVMPGDTAKEKVQVIKAFKGQAVLTDPSLGLRGSREKAREIERENPDSYFLDQFKNTADIGIHREETAKEIKNQIPGHLDAFVCGVGSGGTVMGVGSELKKIYPGLKVVVVEPTESPTLSEGKEGTHGICGISPGFVPEKLDTGVIDRIYAVSTEDARECAKTLASEEGILVGISSGACLSAALGISEELRDGGQVLVTFCDSGEMYLGTDLYD
ncbi:MAG: cysteine synthase family protein [Candidatus Dadabacteria bacterium]|nr:cysteine synthase family protein [Candidatus Dadabacteria bacterium]MDE0662500.1 cysteine synthase family protein [Candidatus Dadabacteria bacterium]